MPCDYAKYPPTNKCLPAFSYALLLQGVSVIEGSRTMKRSGIYRLLNTVTGKSYVGSSIDVDERGRHHFYLLKKGKAHSIKLQNAFNKYGRDSFVFEVLELCPPENLEATETKWATTFLSVENGYNCSYDVKVPSRGYKHSIETRLRMSEAQKKVQTEARKATSAANLAAYNLSLKGVPKTESHRAKIAAANTGRKMSAEIIAKMQGRKLSEETKAKLRGRKHSEESRQKMRDASRHISGAAHPCSRPIAQYTKDGTLIREFAATNDAVRETGIRRESIKNCLCGYSKSGGGFIWRYVRPETLPG